MPTLRLFRHRRAALAFGGALLVGAPLGVLSLSGLQRSSARAAVADPAPTVTVARALQREISDEQIFTGRMQAVNTVALQPRVSGYVEAVLFKDGAAVRTGQVLFRIDPRPYRAEVDRLRAELDQARADAAQADADADRGQRMLPDAIIAKQAAERLQTTAKTSHAKIAAIQAELESAQLNLSWTEVRSPTDGRISNAMIMPGNLVNPQTVLTRIVTVNPMRAYFDVDEQSYLALQHVRQQTGQAPQIMMALADEQAFAHPGTLDFVDNQLDTGSGTIRVRGEFANADGLYTPGLYVRIRLQAGQPRPRLLIDDAALGTDLSNQFVYVVGPDHRIQYRKVETGPLVSGLRVIQSGLAPGEAVVINGLQRVRPDVVVRPEMATMGAALTAQQRAQLLTLNSPAAATVAAAPRQGLVQ
jgi:membrane fusion protein, multidrug efflux system